MKGINHLVLAGDDLDAMAQAWATLGFTLTPTAQHPFGTGNRVIQLHGGYLELLAVTRPHDIVEHGSDAFSFSAFNRDYLARHEGFSMLVIDTPDARTDSDAWRDAGLKTYAPFDFSRIARMPDGTDLRVGFSLAFVTTPEAPWLGHFSCQHHAPAYFEQPQYLRHANTAHAIADVWISGDGAPGLADHFAIIVGAAGVMEEPGLVAFRTPRGTIILAEPDIFKKAFGVEPPHMKDGPHLAGLTVACKTLDRLSSLELERTGNRLVLPPARGFGVAVGFIAA